MKTLILIFLSYAYAERDAAIVPNHPYQIEKNMKEDTNSSDKIKKYHQDYQDNTETPAPPDQKFEFMKKIKENQKTVK